MSEHFNDEELGINRDLEDNKKNMYFSSATILFILFAVATIGFLTWNLFSSHEEEVKEVPKKEGFKSKIEKRIFGKAEESPTKLPISPKQQTPYVEPTKKEVVVKRVRIIKGRGTTIIKSTNKSGDGNKTVINPYRGGAYAVAGSNRFNPNFYIPKGTYIGCSLKHRIVSSLGGDTSCTVSNDIYSANGHVLLLEKGSVVTGSYKGGSIENGVERLYVLWEEVRTPNNVVVNISSAAVGSLGASGIPGEVDNHWGYRLGAAALLSIIDIGISQASSSDNININGSSAISNLGTVALQSFINIKPTLYTNHGDRVGIYVNKDIDFSKIYRLSRKR